MYTVIAVYCYAGLLLPLINDTAVTTAVRSLARRVSVCFFRGYHNYQRCLSKSF